MTPIKHNKIKTCLKILNGLSNFKIDSNIYGTCEIISEIYASSPTFETKLCRTRAGIRWLAVPGVYVSVENTGDELNR
jgi:hypothetical protein